jgi:hypothetical protein
MSEREKLAPGRSTAAYPTHAEAGTDRRAFLKGLGALALATGVGACIDPGDYLGSEGDMPVRDAGPMDRVYPTEGDLVIGDMPPPYEPDAGTDAAPDAGTDASPDAEPPDGGADATQADAGPGDGAADLDGAEGLDAAAQNVHR